MPAPLLCIMGPTASGKTDLAIALAEALDGELVSVDSALVYRGLDIGSAKPQYPHHLIDICDPSEAYSAARFAEDARAAIEGIEARGRRPILVGGTMLYYRALLEGLARMPGASESIRQDIAQRAGREGWPALHRELARIDPVAAENIHPNHSQRISRALEVYRLSGKTLSALHAEPGTGARAPVALCIALAPRDRAVLHRRIELRFAHMMKMGFLDEVRSLHARRDLHPQLPAIRAVGYRQLWEYLSGDCSLEEATARGIAATRQLAKRQFTWLRKWPDLRWIHTDPEGRAVASDLDSSSISASGALPVNLVLSYLTYTPV
jgi:tRNA dimethylallyltransferase